VSDEGSVQVPIEAQRAGVGAINEILTELPDGTWTKVVVSRLGEADEFTEPPAQSLTALWVVLGLVATALATAVFLHWRARKRSGLPFAGWGQASEV
jgi:hypothetical protein